MDKKQKTTLNEQDWKRVKASYIRNGKTLIKVRKFVRNAYNQLIKDLGESNTDYHIRLKNAISLKGSVQDFKNELIKIYKENGYK